MQQSFTCLNPIFSTEWQTLKNFRANIIKPPENLISCLAKVSKCKVSVDTISCGGTNIDHFQLNLILTKKKTRHFDSKSSKTSLFYSSSFQICRQEQFLILSMYVYIWDFSILHGNVFLIRRCAFVFIRSLHMLSTFIKI